MYQQFEQCLIKYMQLHEQLHTSAKTTDKTVEVLTTNNI